MGLVYADIEIVNADDLALNRRGFLARDEIKSITVRALVDSGAYMLAINEHIKAELDLPFIQEQEAELADGTHQTFEIVGPVDVRFENRSTTVRAMVLPGAAEVLLGNIPMEDMDVLIDPRRQQLIVNPETPLRARKSLK